MLIYLFVFVRILGGGGTLRILYQAIQWKWMYIVEYTVSQSFYSKYFVDSLLLYIRNRYIFAFSLPAIICQIFSSLVFSILPSPVVSNSEIFHNSVGQRICLTSPQRFYRRANGKNLNDVNDRPEPHQTISCSLDRTGFERFESSFNTLPMKHY